MTSSWSTSAHRAVIAGVFAVIAMMLIPGSASAQSDSNPKWDLFVGYQYLHPGGTVPAPFGDPNNPNQFKIQDMAKGFGTARDLQLRSALGTGVRPGTQLGPR